VRPAEYLSRDVIETLKLSSASGRELAGRIDALETRALYLLRARARERMVETLRARELDVADSDALWIGWAGPFTSETRPLLLLRDLARLDRLLDDPVQAVRLIVAGGPGDGDGAAALARLQELADDPRFAGRIVVLPGWPNSDLHALVTGVDVWLTTAVPSAAIDPTLAIAAAANGALNLSTATAWWRLAASADNGWTLASAEAMDDPDARAEHDARLLYELLEREVVPLYYGWDNEGVPQRWLTRVRASMRSLAPGLDP
jgi:starch phosphorylase